MNLCLDGYLNHCQVNNLVSNLGQPVSPQCFISSRFTVVVYHPLINSDRLVSHQLWTSSTSDLKEERQRPHPEDSSGFSFQQAWVGS